MDAVCEGCSVGAEAVAAERSSWVWLAWEGPGCLLGWGMQQ